jgi:ubiquinone/menaquinone biosynthesis C-methylase UbiE
MFTIAAAWYDAIYESKDYVSDSAQIDAHIRRHKRSNGVRLLDVACGTGGHLVHLTGQYDAEGLDLDGGLDCRGPAG